MSEFLRDLQAAGRPATTQRSYSLALLRWFRFTWAVEVPWNQATRAEARDFCRWLQLAGKPGRLRPRPGPVPGKRPASARFAPSTVAHCETVCRGFYAYHLEAGTGPIVNPFPLARPGRAHAHHNPMDPFPRQKAGLFRPRVPQRVPRQIPDGVFNELFARLARTGTGRWSRSGSPPAPARRSSSASRGSGADPGQQLITVIRKGSRAIQQLPASPDAFVWLRLYQQEMHGPGARRAGRSAVVDAAAAVPAAGLHAAREMFDRANAAVGAGWTLHSLRHTAAYRLARDPDMPITDVQWVLGHASADDHADLRRPDGRGRHRGHAGPSPAAGRAPARPAGAGAGLPARRAWTCCSGRAAGDRPGDRRRRRPGPAAQRRGRWR